MARQATQGLDGELRFSLNIPARVGYAEISNAIAYFRPKPTDVLPTNRTDAKRLARDFLAKYGTDGSNGSVTHSASRERLNAILAHVDELFPELQPDKIP
jgi:hypothetical protein